MALLALPAGAVLALFAYGMLTLVVYAFGDDGRSLRQVLARQDYINTLLNTHYLAAIVTGICIVLGYPVAAFIARQARWKTFRSEEHTSELQSLMRISYAVFCLKKKKNTRQAETRNITHSIQA